MTTTTEDMIEAAFPAPQPTDVTAPYWRALDEGRLVFQRCGACGHAWLPARSECPHCLAAEAQWTTASGRAKLVSWVVFHHGYHEYFTSRLPYNVAVVELEEGPRLISNVIDADKLRIDMPLALAIQREAGVALARFRPR
jgi:uncharacterized OB-fold protein